MTDELKQIIDDDICLCETILTDKKYANQSCYTLNIELINKYKGYIDGMTEDPGEYGYSCDEIQTQRVSLLSIKARLGAFKLFGYVTPGDFRNGIS